MSKMPADYRRKYRVPAIFIILLKDQQVCLIQRGNTGWMDGKYTLPSGHVEEDETYVEAAVREAKEEVGVDIDPANLRFVHLCERDEEKNDRVWDDVYVICGEFKSEAYNAEPEKHSDLKWADYENLPEAEMIPAIYHSMMCVKQGEYYSAYPG